MGWVVQGGTVVTACGLFRADVRVEGEQVEAVGRAVRQPGDRVLDAGGCYVLPGGVDPHTHIEMPAGDGSYNADTWYTGTVAAAWGGTTTVIDMITPQRGGTLADALEDWRRRAAAGAVVDYGFHMGIISATPSVLDEIPEMVRAGVPTFKLYLAYRSRGLMLEDGDVLRVLRAVAQAGGMALVHAENGDVIDQLVAEAVARGETAPRYHATTRPAAAEAEATARACRLAEIAGAPLYVVHVTCRESLEEILRARGRGQRVWAETCTHYLLFTESDLDRPGFAGAAWVLSPPLRAEADREALWQALARGELQVVASDHCPWTVTHKQRGRERFDLIPNGAPGVEERLPFVYTYGVLAGRLSLEAMVARLSTEPARRFGLYPRKGTVAPGCDADLVVWDPAPQRTWSAAAHHCGADLTPYEGMQVQGTVRHVLVRGRPVVRDGAFAGQAGYGAFVARQGERP